MRLSDVFTAKAIALNYTQTASNKIPYLGAGLFPAKKKMGLDLKWIKGNKGLPVSLAPSTFDAKSKFRDRIGVQIDETEMAFFRESFLVKESDEQEIMRVQDANDPYAQDVLNRIFDDANNLVEGADVVPERMIMQLLSPANGKPGISIVANGADYTYDYDPTGEFQSKNFKEVSSAVAWSDTANSDPLEDLRAGQDAVETETGVKPEIAIMSKKTMGYLVKNAKIRSAILAQNATANIFMTEAKVKALIKTELDLTIIVYSKKYKDENGVAKAFYPDDMVTLVPNGALGNTWYGTTPEERTLMGSKEADVTIVNTGVAVSVTVTSDPVNTKTTASEIVLPSFERMNECYVLKVAGALPNITGATLAGATVGVETAALEITYETTPASDPTLAYQWKISTTSNGTFADIDDATSATYTPVAGDATKYIKCEVTASGSAKGTVLSNAKKVASGE